ncbi:uncharacterized protein CC84DRAFT_1133705 [Paraphaeosphaeria sporulosa]|uniref:ubiquitinyl hydrolase 1 n=1 Tax=Paraphaeosphaeria sporulosa TaxID=1460663 RepID=A0A177CW12_9PLEO|nr:uncharacterized protein CC84DRAFT_1133705 [Paraphaeosphaeria sporulosa]OAG11713.1 hypothetical protein CC84DRAFT_1133705 [Paraphaeosphaeria sporulosa]
MAASRDFLLQLYQHVALPRDVPGTEDRNLCAVEAALLDRILQAATNLEGTLDKDLLAQELADLGDKRALLLYVKEQNAAILVYKDAGTNGEHVLFEAFEAAANCEAVVASENALRRDFPAYAASVPSEVYLTRSFQESFASFLQRASIEPLKRFAAVTYKAGAPLPEIRGTMDPSLITEFLMTVLEANGMRCDVPLLRKRIHDTISFKDARIPWRRSPLYLAIRVAMQRHLYKIMGPNLGHFYYKLIMALFLSRLLGECYRVIPHEAAFNFMQKLGRRLAKIEHHQMSVSGHDATLRASLFDKMQRDFKMRLENTRGFLVNQWNVYRAKTRRPIRILPKVADPNDSKLQLPSSGHRLRLVAFGASWTSPPQLFSPRQLLERYEAFRGNTNSFAVVADRYLELASTVEVQVVPMQAGYRVPIEWETRCCALARTIGQYVSSTKDLLEGYPEMKSRFLLDVMELWAELDRHAIVGFPLLKIYHPGFDPELLDALEFLHADDMQRVEEVQTYIKHRCNGWAGSGSKTIFDPPAEDSFASVYYNELGEYTGLAQLREEIQADAEELRTHKEEEWETKLEQYKQTLQEIEESPPCPGFEEIVKDGVLKSIHKSACPKHRLAFKARSIKIEIFEDPLPKDEATAKAAVFELRCPLPFAAYRDATWLLLSILAHVPVQALEDVPTLRGYNGLSHYANSVLPQVTLGSSTKSHLDCHYAETGFPVELHQIWRPCGLTLRYYDTGSQSWTQRDDKMSFSRHIPLMLPSSSPYNCVGVNTYRWPSSNDILASQTKCPADLNVHEFMAWQELLSGTNRRWLSLLRELGATNLNFSTESTWAIVTKLVLQVGPSFLGHPLRDIHMIFDDDTFCNKLLEQVSNRLDAVRRNWREPVQMDLLITLLLKVISLSSCRDVQRKALELLEQVRIATWKWCLALHSPPPNVGQDSTIFALWASVLCKRAVQRPVSADFNLDTKALEYLIGASIILQESLVGPFDDLPYALRKLLLDDLLYSFQHRIELASLVKSNVEALLSAINYIWPLPSGASADLPTIRIVPQSWWVEISIQARQERTTHLVHYHLFRGDFLIDGKQSGILPAVYHKPVIHTLFGTYALRVLPSYMPGMSYYVAHSMPFNHKIHLGFRQGELVVRAFQGPATLELIDASIFTSVTGSNTQHDLPLPLITGCFHWLNIDSKILEIRQGDKWRSKKSNWRLNLNTSEVTRKSSSLVDPFSTVALNVAHNFLLFETAEHILVTQPQKGRLCVELRRLELNFVVNHSNLLQCRELGAEVVYTDLQDIGAWYGCFSKIVLRSIKNERHRLILVPEGRLQFGKHGGHVRIRVIPEGSYLRFDVDDVLGRIQCPAEHRLLYTKAMWHAYTSHVFSDPLTGRTGLEEALCLLQSGLYKPWAPIRDPMVPSILANIANLSPVRAYYPEDLRCMEVVTWNQHLTTTIQDDRYRALIEDIYRRASQLQLFTIDPLGCISHKASTSDPHLVSRSVSRLSDRSPPSDTFYAARGSPTGSVARDSIALITKYLSEWSISNRSTGQLAQILQKYSIIGGLSGPFDRIALCDLISVDVVENWCALVQTAMEAGPDDRYRLMFLLAPMALSPRAPVELLQVLVAYATLPALKDIEMPVWPSYVRFKLDEIPATKDLAESMKEAHQPHEAVPKKQGDLPGQMALARIHHEEACQHNCLQLAQSILLQWPQVDIDVEKVITIDAKFLNNKAALDLALVDWRRLAQNFQLSQYIERVQQVLDEQSASIDSLTNSDILENGFALPEPHRYFYHRSRAVPTLQELLLSGNLTRSASKGTSIDSKVSTIATAGGPWKQLPNGHVAMLHNKGAHEGGQYARTPSTQQPHLKELRGIVEVIQRGTSGQPASAVQREYGRELMDSIEALGKRTSNFLPNLSPSNSVLLKQQIHEKKQSCDEALRALGQALEVHDRRATWLKASCLWPKMTKIALLSELRSTSESAFGPGIKEAVIDLGLRITHWQRLLRVEDASLRHKKQQLQEELSNEGHVNWNPLTRSDWLLLEIDGNIMLRMEQVEVANATIAPATGCNSVTQLLMGKGKTSCILPMVAAILADRQNLLRIVVPRALLLQSAQVMHIKLGGLLNREIMHLPFSRRTKADNALLETLGQLHSTLKKSGGVLLSLPESILSFKLGGLQRLCDDKLEQANIMIKMQQWLDRNARDVLDECDVSLAIRTQLIYPSGFQMAVDGHPLRWQTVQAVLRLVLLFIPELNNRYPHSIEVVTRPSGGFPLIYLLRRDVEDHLISLIVEAICKGQIAALPCAEILSSAQDDIRVFISSSMVASHVVSKVNGLFKEKQHLMKILCLLRGLFVHRILLSALKKRWNVQYGLHPTRDPIAVPYHAKGVPSPTSEWGHPDVAIILTCLSFYYQGLSVAQFKQAFEQLLKSDEPSVEYEKWATRDLPGCLRDYTAINVDDNMQLRSLHQYVRSNIYLLDFYLNNFVFPRHAKQFDTKLQASGWDLVLFDPSSPPNCRTTGFSGTNDSRHQLPMMIKQNDLPNLAHTNAEVLSYLLEKRNRGYVHMMDELGRRWSEESLLSELHKPNKLFSKEPIRILIDAGAQILEHDNLNLARTWLNIDWEATAAVYFDDEHRPWVLYRKGKRIPLLATPFAENLEGCLVYLDESHCRGTDLKLPPNARAALTLGPHVSKDAVAQAAMRLRLLGQTQAVTFFAPPEVHQSIVDLMKKSAYDHVYSSDVVAWLLKQSCNGIEQLEPLYYNQGNTYIKHEYAKIRNSGFLKNIYQRSEYLSVIRTKESQTLKQMYEPKSRNRGFSGDTRMRSYRGVLGLFATELDQRKKDFQDSGIAIHSSALEEVEQEREIENEVENNREPEKPFHFTALNTARLHEDIKEFAKSGRVVAGSEAYQPMLSALQCTASGRRHGAFAQNKSPGLYVSKQFSRTVKVTEPNDNFIRPCQWILWSITSNKALVISPEEADALLPYLRQHRPAAGASRIHLIVYSAPITRRMLHFNDLSYHATPPLIPGTKVPSWLKIELGIFAGRLYFEWHEYEGLLSYLGVQTMVGGGEYLGNSSRDTFVQKPLTFVHDWLAALRKGQDFEHTPMGFITTGKPLSADHPFFLTDAAEELGAEANAPVPPGGAMHQDEASLNEMEDDDEDDEDDFHDGEDHGGDTGEDNRARFEEGDNTFFDAVEQFEVDEEEGREGDSSGVNTE